MSFPISNMVITHHRREGQGPRAKCGLFEPEPTQVESWPMVVVWLSHTRARNLWQCSEQSFPKLWLQTDCVLVGDSVTPWWRSGCVVIGQGKIMKVLQGPRPLLYHGARWTGFMLNMYISVYCLFIHRFLFCLLCCLLINLVSHCSCPLV